MPFNPYFIPVFLAALICGTLAIYAWRQRPRPGAVEFALLLAAIAIHCLGYSMELLNNELGPIVFWLRVEYLGISTEPSLWIALVLQYTNRSRWLTPRNIALLAIIPICTLLLNYTNDLHHFYYADLFVDYSGPYPLLAIVRGPWYYVHSAYLFSAFLGGSIWLFIQARRAEAFYRAQNLIMVLAASAPLITYVLYMLDIQPVKHLDVTPVSFAVTGIIAAWGLFRYRLILVRPVARDALFEYIQSGVILLDGEGQLTDINPAAVRFLDLHPPLPMGKDLTKIILELPSAFDLDPDMEERTFEWQYRGYDLEVRITPLKGKKEGRVGYVVLLSDITQMKQVQQFERRLMEQQRSMAVLEERERLASDLHDGVGQVLGYVSVQAQAASQFLENNQVLLARTVMDNLSEVSRDAHADIRTFILGVRTPSEKSEVSFFDTLKKYTDQFSRHYDLLIETHLPQEPDPCPLSSEAQVQILSIIQEALNNTRKHAFASRVDITFEYLAQQVRILIADDGRGFDPHAGSSGSEDHEEHFGLHIMTERARTAGGKLEIQSAQGEGCQVIIHLPVSTPPNEEEELSKLRVIIVDDQPLFRNGMRYLLQSRGVQVVGEASDGDQAMQVMREKKPSMVLMDYHMPGMDGLQAAQKIKAQWPKVKILILTIDRAEGILVDSIRAGADGYLPKDIEASRLFDVIKRLMRGEPAFASEMAAQTLVTLARQQGVEELIDQFPALTPRQREILNLMAADLTNREIGERLFLSEAAIKYHAGQIFEALGVKSRQEALQKVRQKR